jgi:CheY-like chemotaxis protein
MKNKALGTHDIARICQVTPPTAIRWIEQGKLPSFTTGGGHRRVWDKDLVIFLKEHNFPVPPDLEPGCLKILIVDDEPQIRRLLIKVLGKSYPEAEIHEAADGFDAGRKVTSLLPSLIILDIQLPGIDGLNICQTIRSDEKLKGAKIMAVTGQDIEESRKQMLAAGADDFLGKPFDIQEITRKIEKLLAPGPAGGKR